MGTASRELRRLLRAPELLTLPGVFDGISAHAVRRAGFAAAYVTGAGVAASGFGQPHVGRVTSSEMVERVGMLVRASAIPLLADADTGYGNPMHTVHTVRAYEQAGVAGLHLEDQAFPKRCGHLADKQVVDVDEYVAKLVAALENRQDDIVVVARTDARGPLGIDEAISRGLRFAAEGADAVFIEAPQSREEIERIADEVCRATDVPVVFNVVPGGRTPVIEEAELARLGFAAAIHPGVALWPATAAVSEGFTTIGGEPAVSSDAGPAALFDLVGLREWADLGKRYDEGRTRS